jgi:hypothetical protein
LLNDAFQSADFQTSSVARKINSPNALNEKLHQFLAGGVSLLNLLRDALTD